MRIGDWGFGIGHGAAKRQMSEVGSQRADDFGMRIADRGLRIE